MFLPCNWQLKKKNCKIMFLRCNLQLKKKIDLVFNLSANVNCLIGIFLRILHKNEFWSFKCKAINRNGNIQKNKTKKKKKKNITRHAVTPAGDVLGFEYFLFFVLIILLFSVHSSSFLLTFNFLFMIFFIRVQ